MTERNGFSYESYIKNIRYIIRKGFSITNFQNAKGNEYEAIIRHDVDVSMSKAAIMARIEKVHGIQSTYFVMLSSRLYNLLDAENEKRLFLIKELGHEVGLHFDISKYGDISDKEFERCVKRELNILENILGEKVKSVSWHMPPYRLLGSRIKFIEDMGIKNAYDPVYFHGYAYKSDSRMERIDIKETVDSAIAVKKIQLLTHPIWYSEEGCKNPENIKESESEKHDIYNRMYLNSVLGITLTTEEKKWKNE